MATIKSAFLKLQDYLELTQYPGRRFKFGIPNPVTSYDPQDKTVPGMFLDWFRGRYQWTASMCGGTDLKSGEVVFNALIVMEQGDVDLSNYPGLLANEALALHMIDLGETMIRKVIAGNADPQGWLNDFFANPAVLTHTFVKDESSSMVNLEIRVSHFASSYLTP